MTAKAVMSSHKPIRIYMGNLILGVKLYFNTGFCFPKLFLMVGKEIRNGVDLLIHMCSSYYTDSNCVCNAIMTTIIV